jgi:hypothetical protein
MCCWILDSKGKVKGLRIPATRGYGKDQILSCAEVIGRFTPDQILEMRRELLTTTEASISR